MLLRAALTRLQAEVARQLAKLPAPESVVLSADKSNCVRAADLLTIQKHIASGRPR